MGGLAGANFDRERAQRQLSPRRHARPRPPLGSPATPSRRYTSSRVKFGLKPRCTRYNFEEGTHLFRDGPPQHKDKRSAGLSAAGRNRPISTRPAASRRSAGLEKATSTLPAWGKGGRTMVTLAGSRKVGQSRAPLRHSSRRAASEKLVRPTPVFIWGTVAD